MMESRKKLVNRPETAVDDCLVGFVLSNKNVKLVKKHRMVVRGDRSDLIRKGQVCLISGGGSGHEPSQAGFVGKGMLTAAVCGDIFASPPPASILECIKICSTTGGILLIVTNYTGDRLNFGRAAEQAKQKGINIEMVIVDDDSAVVHKRNSAGKRGLCGTVFVHKIAGALAERGESLSFITQYARNVVRDMRTISISLSPCSIPGQPATFSIPSDAFEFGLGVHGEPGIKQMKMTSSSEISDLMIDYITRNERSPQFEGKEVAVIINNLGSTSVMEMNIFVNDVLQNLSRKQMVVRRCFVGRFMTSLEMAGVSVSMLLVDDKRLQLLDYETTCHSWQQGLMDS
eukprot:Seg3402.1 transcript_id=Seg3402.1/GoldUCD/mRNA.D3Y31 product="Triokinase/FMN cyclase" protein_id=Seg3402.1/GoldUCD/D3Y31